LIIPLAEPWDAVDPASPAGAGDAPHLAVGLGPVIVCDGDKNPRAVGLSSPLPRSGPRFELGDGEILCAYDLPVSQRSFSSEIRLSSSGKRLQVFLDGQVPRARPVHGGRGLGESDESQLSEDLESFVNLMVGVMLELRHLGECVAGRSDLTPDFQFASDLHVSPEEFGRGRLPYARLPWSAVAKCLLEKRDEPPVDVIVRIAEVFNRELIDLTEQPRRVLRRERRRTQLGRVQQIDSTCIVWLVRQPGRTPVEKAGPSQQILAVIRDEDYDTLENRVLKDFLKRSIIAAGLYVRQHKRKYRQSERYKAVERFGALCERLLLAWPFAGVRSLNRIPQPNYVLQHDPAYRKLWTWYLRLVRRKRQNDEAWRWQRRLWADTVRLCVAAALHHFSEEGLGFEASSFYEHDLWVHAEQQEGCWLTTFDWPGPVTIRASQGGQEVVAQFVHPHAAEEADSVSGFAVSKWMGILGADAAVVFAPLGQGVSSKKKACLFVWGIHSASESLSDKRVAGQPKAAQRALLRLRSSENIKGIALKGLILRSKFVGEAEDLPPSGAKDDVEVLGLAMPADPSEWREEVLGLVRYCFCECAMECCGST